jgi:protein arginine kinase activator
VGKLPQRAHRTIELSDRMKTLTADLEKAVAEENYETAATLRDQIRQLEHEMAS